MGSLQNGRLLHTPTPTTVRNHDVVAQWKCVITNQHNFVPIAEEHDIANDVTLIVGECKLCGARKNITIQRYEACSAPSPHAILELIHRRLNS